MTAPSDLASTTPKYSLGQEIWWAKFENTPEYHTCPDCGGLKYIRCILHDDTEVRIDCQGCSLGFNPPSGIVTSHAFAGTAMKTQITGLDVTLSKIEYRVPEGYIIPEDRLFLTEAEALEKAATMAEEYTAAARAKVLKKEKDTKSWAWHVTYHRREIRRHTKELAYHTEKLEISLDKSKGKASG